MKRVVGICIYLLCVGLLAGQELKDYQKELGLKIDDSDIKKLTKGVELVRKGLQQHEEANQLYNNLDEAEQNRWKSSGHKKALKSIAEASELVAEGHNIIFNTYKDYCEAFWETQSDEGHYAAGMNKAKYYERRASNEIGRARLRREQVNSSENFTRAKAKFEQAVDYERIAIRDQGRALQIYQDFPVEYDYGWTDDVDAETVAKHYQDEWVLEPEDVTTSTTDTVVITRIDTVFMAAETKQQAAEEDTVETRWLPEVQFKVQIAAHVKPISNAQISAMYSGSERVNVVFEDNWYKYQMGPYEKYRQAQAVLKACGVDKAFIVPYREGKKLTIKEALRSNSE